MRREITDKKLFQIGDVAKMFHISVGSLRHYEQAGLLKPEYIDENSGYRYYSTRQFEVLNTIRYLRLLDMPLNQIADFLQNKDIDVIEDKLLKQKEIIARKQQELAIIERKIDRRLQQLRDAVSSDLNTIRLVNTPPCRIAWIEDTLELNSYLDLEYSIRRLEEHQAASLTFLGKVGVGIARDNLIADRFEHYNLVFLLLDDEDTYEGNITQLPAVTCVSVRFCGSHSEAAVYYQKLMDYIHGNHLEITGFSREITMIDYGITNDTDKFVTEILIPVA
ncbi:MAG: MerR family transcriptional regulator [Dorea sp.]|jgi:DNA-binding transcriptional MerR regulator|nr:MerR family transcriptional regulator [Dorea sp.]